MVSKEMPLSVSDIKSQASIGKGYNVGNSNVEAHQGHEEEKKPSEGIIFKSPSFIESHEPSQSKELLSPPRIIYLDMGNHIGEGFKSRGEILEKKLQELLSSGDVLVFLECSDLSESEYETMVNFQDEGHSPFMAKILTTYKYMYLEDYRKEYGKDPSDIDLDSHMESIKSKGITRNTFRGYDNFHIEFLAVIDEVAEKSSRKVILSSERASDDVVIGQEKIYKSMEDKAEQALREILSGNIAGGVNFLRESEEMLQTKNKEREERVARDVLKDMERFGVKSAVVVFGGRHEQGLFKSLQDQVSISQKESVQDIKAEIRIMPKPADYISHENSYNLRPNKSGYGAIDWTKTAIEYALKCKVIGKINSPYTFKNVAGRLINSGRKLFGLPLNAKKVSAEVFSSIGKLIDEKLPDEESVNRFIDLAGRVGFDKAATRTFGNRRLRKLVRENTYRYKR